MIASLDRLYALAQKLAAAERTATVKGEANITLETNEVELLRSLATDYIESAQEAQNEVEV